MSCWLEASRWDRVEAIAYLAIVTEGLISVAMRELTLGALLYLPNVGLV
ncbi:MAG: hypothetical protein F6K28_44200, partial [Microcoleus sp. SIO2G3]|nr:hypothetical protein [Microcoleus sp. SIO2G3]